jgi:hypothetical protein
MWDRLYGDFAGLLEAERARDADEQRARLARDEFAEWSRFAAFRVMSQVAEQARARAAELLDCTGAVVKVGELASHGDPSLRLGPETLHLALRIQDAEVFVFATRLPDGPPYVFFGSYGWAFTRVAAARQRFVSFPGVGLVRTGPTEIALRDAGIPGRLGAELPLETLTLKAFQLLAQQLGVTRRRATVPSSTAIAVQRSAS